jgi:hypothetical protein
LTPLEEEAEVGALKRGEGEQGGEGSGELLSGRGASEGGGWEAGGGLRRTWLTQAS